MKISIPSWTSRCTGVKLLTPLQNGPPWEISPRTAPLEHRTENFGIIVTLRQLMSKTDSHGPFLQEFREFAQVMERGNS